MVDRTTSPPQGTTGTTPPVRPKVLNWGMREVHPKDCFPLDYGNSSISYYSADIAHPTPLSLGNASARNVAFLASEASCDAAKYQTDRSEIIMIRTTVPLRSDKPEADYLVGTSGGFRLQAWHRHSTKPINNTEADY